MIKIFKNMLLSQQLVGVQINNHGLYCSFIKLNEQNKKNNKAEINSSIELILEKFELNNFEIHDLSIYNYYAVSQKIEQFLLKYNIKRTIFLFSLEGVGVTESIEETFVNSLEIKSDKHYDHNGNQDNTYKHEQTICVGSRKINYVVSIDQEKLIQFNLLAQMFNYKLFAVTTPIIALYYAYTNLCINSNVSSDNTNILENNFLLDNSLEVNSSQINIDGLKKFMIDKMVDIKVDINSDLNGDNLVVDINSKNNNSINLDKSNLIYNTNYNVLSALGLYYFWKVSQ